MTIVVGTAGHIDHGKTTLLRALTGIDADRLPEERRRGMTIDVGYAHLALEEGRSIDFVDVPGHDRLVGNMLVGAGEIDAVLLVVAADDGPRAQTLEHLALLDALGLSRGLVVVTKTDGVSPDRVAEVVGAVERVLAPTSLAGLPILPASGLTGEGLDAVRAALVALDAAVGSASAAGSASDDRPASLAIDRVFSVKGRGVVVTGTARGGQLTVGDHLRIVPGDRAGRDETVRIREIQVHGRAVERVVGGGRTALNLAGADVARLHRGDVVTADPAIVATDRVLAVFGWPVPDRTRGRLHAGTAAVDAAIGRAGRDALTLPDGRAAGVVRLSSPIALRPGDRVVLRRGPTVTPVGGVVIDTSPPRGISRRRQTPERVAALAGGGEAERLDLHGAVADAGRVQLASDVLAAGVDAAAAAAASTVSTGSRDVSVAVVRVATATAIRRLVTLHRNDAALAASAVVERLVEDGRLVRAGDLVRLPGTVAAAPDPALAAAMDRLEVALACLAPPPLGGAARDVGCPPAAIRTLEQAGRIVVLDADLAYAMSTYRDLSARALGMAAREPLTPAAFRDATGTSRKYVMAILEDLDRRGILRRTPVGHVPGPRASTAGAALAATTPDAR